MNSDPGLRLEPLHTHSTPIDQASLYETLPRLHYPGWLREWVRGDVLARLHRGAAI
jgi:hypothetical protein